MDSKGTIYKKSPIQKFKGKFKEIDGGGTILFTKTIQSITSLECLAVYIYLASKPPEWQINIKDIMRHFSIGKNKAYKIISDLILIGLITRKEIRDKGKFLDYEYYLHLSPIPQNRDTVSPIPGKPVPGKPVPGNRETYKEKNSLKKIEDKKAFYSSIQEETQEERLKRYVKERENNLKCLD